MMARVSTLADVLPDGGEDGRQLPLRDQAVPEPEVAVDECLESAAAQGREVAPRIAPKQFVPAGPGQDHLDETRGQFGRVPVRIALPDPRLLDVPHQIRMAALHITGLEDHLVVLGAEEIRQALRLRTLVQCQFQTGGRRQIEADREGADEGELARGQRRDGAGVEPAAQIGPEVHVGDEHPVDRLHEETVELLGILAGVPRHLGFLEIEVPVCLGFRDLTPNPHLDVGCGGQDAGPPVESPRGEEILKGEVLD